MAGSGSAGSAGPPRDAVARLEITRITGGTASRAEDAVAVERALEIRVGDRPLSVTLRTPGHDEELAVGFLAGEGLVSRAADIVAARALPAACADEPDAITLELAAGVRIDWARLERHFAASAACGLCGRAHLESLRAGLAPVAGGPAFPAAALAALPGRLGAAQAAFGATGGLHAAAWCDEALVPRVVREDVGRHNAVDKVAGWLVREGRYPAGAGLLWVSGRAGAEIVLKAARARIPVLAAVGAPSSLAVELARTARMTLVGFLRGDRMNVYAGAERIASRPA